MKITGKVHEIGQTQQVSDTFSKRDLVLEYAENPSYPEYIKFDTMQDKTKLLDGLSVGQEIEVDFNLRGRPWTDKTGKVSYFNTLAVWKINAIGNAPVVSNAPGADDDLPF